MEPFLIGRLFVLRVFSNLFHEFESLRAWYTSRMSLIFITGTSTAGKSTIAKELSKLGYEVYDTEHDGMSAWFNRRTGKRAAEFNEIPERTKEWLDQHEWLIDVKQVAQLAQKAQTSGIKIFLCGGSSNEAEIRTMCDQTIWLKTDEETIRKRVLNPRDHDYGTRPHELAKAINDNKHKEAEYRDYGATFVDGTRPIHEVIEAILKITAVK